MVKISISSFLVALLLSSACNHGHNIQPFLIFYQFFPSPEVKWSVVIGNNNCIHELPQKFSNDSRLRLLLNWTIPGKSQSSHPTKCKFLQYSQKITEK